MDLSTEIPTLSIACGPISVPYELWLHRWRTMLCISLGNKTVFAVVAGPTIF